MLITFWLFSLSSDNTVVISVRVNEGHTALHAILYLPPSLATALVKPFKPALEEA